MNLNYLDRGMNVPHLTEHVVLREANLLVVNLVDRHTGHLDGVPESSVDVKDDSL